MGVKLKEARRAALMTQQELANKSGVSRTMISLLESGATKDAKASTLLRLANALGKTLDDIFFDETVKPT